VGGEICKLTIYDIDFRAKTVRVNQGKGRKDRLVPIGKSALKYAKEYAQEVRPMLLAQHAGSHSAFEPSVVELLFFTRRRNPFTTKELYKIVKKYREDAGLPDSVTVHSFRHACATEMLKGGAGVRHVQEMLGHNHMSTTQMYTHVAPHDLKKVHARTAPSQRRTVIEVPRFEMKAWQDKRNSGCY